jgi:cytochrome b561
VARILWRAFNPPPPEPSSVGRLEGLAARAVHMSFYALLLVVPVSGWLMVTTSPVQIETVLFFQEWLPWPHLPGFDGLTPEARAEITHITEWVHAVLAYGMGVLVALHVAGAVKHHVADRAFIRRMSVSAPGDGPRNSYGHATVTLVTLVFFGAMVAAGTVARTPEAADFAGGVSPDQAEMLATAAPPPETAEPAPREVAASAAGEVSAPAVPEEEAPALAPLWEIDPAGSDLTFSLVFSGEEITGRFADFDATVRFDPDNLDGSSISVSVPTTSAELDSTAISQNQLAGSDGFANEEFGVATFEADEIREADEGYVAAGTLTIRGNEVGTELPFDVDIDGATAAVAGSVTLDRFDFGIGVENDASGDWLNPEIVVTVSLSATRAENGGQTTEAAAPPAPAAVAPTGPAPAWRMLPDESAVAFSFGFQGGTVEGAIEAFATDIRFDPENLEGSSVYVSLDLATATVEGTAVTESQLKGADGLAASDERLARFRADTIRQIGEGSYEADGVLELRGVEVPITLPFDLFIVEGRAVAEGTATLDRLAFGVGEENDPDGTMISPQVEVLVRVTAVSEEARPDFSR